MKSVVSVVVRARWVCMCKARAAATWSGVRSASRARIRNPTESINPNANPPDARRHRAPTEADQQAQHHRHRGRRGRLAAPAPPPPHPQSSSSSSSHPSSSLVDVDDAPPPRVCSVWMESIPDRDCRSPQCLFQTRWKDASAWRRWGRRGSRAGARTGQQKAGARYFDRGHGGGRGPTQVEVGASRVVRRSSVDLCALCAFLGGGAEQANRVERGIDQW